MATPKKTNKPKTSAQSTKGVASKSKSEVAAQSSKPMISRAQMALEKARNNRLFLLLAAVIIIGALAYLVKDYVIVAMVNGRPITRLEVIQELEKQGGEATADALISEVLLNQQAQKQGVIVSQDEIDSRIKEIEDELSQSGQSLDQLLELQGVTRAEVEEQTRLRLLLQKLLEDKVAVTDEEVNEAFESQAEQKPEEMSDEEFKQQLRESLREQKLSFEAQSYIQELKDGADIQYLYQY